MNTQLLNLLVCPLCKGKLNHRPQTQELICPVDRLAFPIKDGIPMMLESEARTLEAHEDAQ